MTTTPLSRQPWWRPLLTASLLLATACSPAGKLQASDAEQSALKPGKTSTAAPATEALAASLKDVHNAIGLRCQADADCTTWGLGSRACGGPAQYLAYAPADSQMTPLRTAAARYAALSRQQQQALGAASICVVLQDPGAQCSAAGQCVLRTSGLGQRGGAANDALR